MSSYRRKGSSNERDLIPTPAPCPDCGKIELVYARGPCELLDGTVLDDLRRLRCKSCGAEFFDDAAMESIEKSRRSSTVKT